MMPRVFIGSSSEGLGVASAIQADLDDDAEVTVWNQDVFKPGEYTLESLFRELGEVDVGVFVFSPDDTVRMRGEEQAAVRDNVLFEFGMFVGRLGRDRSFIVTPKGEDFRLPSDLLGLNGVEYKPNRRDGNLRAALKPASDRLLEIVDELPPKPSAPEELGLPVFERRGLLTEKQRVLLREIERSPERTFSDLRRRFPEMSESELHYRLEQLRLLALIRSSGEHDPNDRTYFLDGAYRAAYEQRVIRELGSGHASP
jgi:hypothetical protein